MLLLAELLPRTPTFDKIAGLSGFYSHHRRLPRRPDHPQAWISDIVFARACSDDWTAQQRRCADKVTAVEEACAAAPELRFAQRHAVIDVPAGATLRDIQSMLAPYLGQQLVAKPAHSCGGMLFLEEEVSPAAWREFHRLAVTDYYVVSRERLYRGLPRRIVVEERLGERLRELADFKFFCSHGSVFAFNYVVDLHTEWKRTLYRLPERTPMPYSLPIPDTVAWGRSDSQLPADTPMPLHLDAMIDIAARLSAPYDLVRIDLYDLPDGPYFGEYTFLHSGGRVPHASMELSDMLVRAVRGRCGRELGSEPR